MIGEEKNGITTYERKAGGAPFNVACALKKFGADVKFVGSVGDDLIGQFLDAGVVAALICQAGNFGKDSLTDAGYGSGASSDLSHNGASLSMF